MGSGIPDSGRAVGRCAGLERWSDAAGEQRICLLCDEQWVAGEMETRAFIGPESIGHVGAACAAADPDELLQRMRPAY